MNVSQVVQTVFTAAGVSSFVSSMGSVSNVASGVASKLGGITAALGAVGSAAGILDLGKKIISVSDDFEKSKTVIAGFLSSLDFAKDYASGLKSADSVLSKIIRDSAKLPGEAEEYITVFKAGLPAVSGAAGKGMNDIVAFTNQFAASAKVLGVEAGEAGVELQKMLSPGHGTAVVRSPMFRQLLTFMHKIPGEANLTAQSFNTMTAPKRFELLQKTLGLFGPTLKEAASGWDAMSGAFASNTRMMIRLGGTPIFEEAKKTLGRINDLMTDADGHLTPLASKAVVFGQTIGVYVVGAFEKALGIVTQIGGKLDSIGSRIAGNAGFKAIGSAIGNIGGAAKTLVSGVGAGLTEKSQVTISSAANPLDVLGKRFLIFTQVLDPAAKILGTLSGYGKDLFQTFTNLQDAVNIVIRPIFAFEAAMLGIYNSVLTRLRPAFAQIQTAFSHLWHSGAKVLNPAIRILGAVVAKGAKIMGNVLVPVLSTLAKAISWVIERLSDLLDWIGKKLEKVAPKEADLKAGPSVWDEFSNTFDELMKAFDKKEDEIAGGAGGTPATPGGAGVYQDFRGSKFDITQKFAEGFDPDRIAVSFAQDLGRIGETPLQSGHEPLMGVR